MTRGLTPIFAACLFERFLSGRDEVDVGLPREVELPGELAQRPLDVQEGRRRDLAEHRTVTAPGPLDSVADHACAHRIEHDVSPDLEAVRVVVDPRVAEPSLEQMPYVPVPAVE